MVLKRLICSRFLTCDTLPFVFTVLQAVIIGNVYILFIMRFPKAASACEALLK